MGKLKVVFWASDTHGCRYVRCQLPAEAINLHSELIECEVVDPGTLKDKGRSEVAKVANADIVVFARSFFPEAKYEMFDALQKVGRALIYELDDNIFDIPTSNYSRDSYPKEELRRISEAVRRCDHVIASTPPLGKELSKFNNRVTIAPNSVDLTLQNWARERKEDGRIRIGWFGAGNHEADLREAAQAMIQLSKRRPEITITMLGWMTREIWAGVPEGQLEFYGYAPVSEYYPNLGKMNLDVAVMPIKDHSFNRCKSNNKVLEAGLFGYPVIVSNVGPYKATVTDRENGLVVDRDRPKDWFRALVWAVDHPMEMRQYAENLREKVVMEYDINSTYKIWEEVFLNVAKSNGLLKQEEALVI